MVKATLRGELGPNQGSRGSGDRAGTLKFEVFGSFIGGGPVVGLSGYLVASSHGQHQALQR